MTFRSLTVFSRGSSVFAVLAVLMTVLTTNALFGEESQVPYDSFTSPEGTSYVAIGMRCPPILSTANNEVVFLVDTSASQVGQTRTDAFMALRSAIENLPKGTHVQLYALDVDAVPLTPDFVATDSAELGRALQKLQRRVPLGATDMNQGLAAARNAFNDRNGENKRSVVYIGHGRSMAKTVDVSDFENEMNAYRAAKIPFSACAVGVQTNLGLIGAFANQTGGNLIDMNVQIKHDSDQALETAEMQGDEFVVMPNFGDTAGQQLAQAITATVIWPEEGTYSFPNEWEVYPKALQPVRSDRETIVVAKTDAAGLVPFKFEMKGKTADNEIDMRWSFAPDLTPGAAAGNKYLAAVVETAAKDEGLTMPIVGWNSLDTIRDGFIVNVADRLDKADAALKVGNPQQAMTILNNVDENYPYVNGTAARLKKQAESMLKGELIEMNEDDAGDENALPSMVDSIITQQSASVQKIQVEVNYAITEANRMVDHDPEGAIQTLKLTQVMVRDNTDLDPSQRNQMLDRLGNAVRQAQHTQFVNEFRRQRQDEIEAAQRERQQSLHDLEAARIKAVQIFDRFAALMKAGEYKVATTVAEVAMDLLPESTTPFAAQRLAEMTSYITEYNKIRHRRQVGFVESLMEAERSFIPVPDEPPITYIDPERWLLLSERRKERYSVADLSQSGAAEKKITKALDKNIDLELDENMTFEELFEMIKDKNPGVNISIDPRGAGVLGITSSSPVVREPVKYHGIKLRSALRLILREQDLTYCIKDEVLLITSEEEAKKYMSIKVYPVADLVVDPTPIQGSSSGSMGGMGGGGMGGMMNGGGMGGGMGGMGGGMGGMGGGMGGGGMGGGMWNVPDSIKRLYGVSNMNAPANGTNGKFFSKPDEVRKDTPTRAKMIVREAQAASDACEFWENFFSGKKVDEDLVKAIVQQLLDEMKANKRVEDHVVALVESAILNDAVQPWMYEALALSLYLKGAPKKELERAVLSAADFCDNPIDLMNLGLFMRALDLKERAFLMYKQALEVMVPKQEFYSATLKLAQDIEDEESLRWICLAILNQEWDGSLGAKMSQEALDSMQYLEHKMKKTGRTEEAIVLAREVREARLRDCVVTVEWTGNAGLDLMVREPADSFCWFGAPRSISGGLLKSTPMTDNGPVVGTLDETAGVKRISYVCPKGFNGRYAVVLQKEWGDPANNRIKIAVDTNVIPGENMREGTAISMKPDGVIVYFDLESGRRTETLEEGKLNEAELRSSIAQKQMARNNAIRRLSDQGILAQVLGGSGETSGSSSSSSRGNSVRDYLTYGPSVVGYRPVITTLPQGIEMTANAVVSADRRYVRTSPYSPFYDIRNVMKYNIATGSNDLDSNSSGSGSGSGSSGGLGGGSSSGSGGY